MRLSEAEGRVEAKLVYIQGFTILINLLFNKIIRVRSTDVQSHQDI